MSWGQAVATFQRRGEDHPEFQSDTSQLPLPPVLLLVQVTNKKDKRGWENWKVQHFCGRNGQISPRPSDP